MNSRRVLVALVASSLAFAGCSSVDGTPRAEPSTAPATTTSTPSTTTAPPTTTAAPSAAPQPYRFTSERIVGANDRVQYDVSIPQVTGGSEPVATEFNESLRSSLQDQIDGFDDARFTLSDARPGPTYIGGKVISAVLNISWDANPPGAHPTYIVTTVTVNTETGGPVTLEDLFPDLQEGLERLSQQSAAQLPATAAGPGFERSGIEPTVANFANWAATPQGMNIRFGDYQVGPHAVGLIDITIPWANLADVADPYILDILRS